MADHTLVGEIPRGVCGQSTSVGNDCGVGTCNIGMVPGESEDAFRRIAYFRRLVKIKPTSWPYLISSAWGLSAPFFFSKLA